MARATSTVYVVPADVTTGQWCESCALPSAVSVTVWTYTRPDGSDLAQAGTVTYCTDCQEPA